MKVAMTVWGNRISPVFDSAQTILLAEISDGSIGEQVREFVADTSGAGLARALIEKEIDTLICGAISDQPARLIESAGIGLIAFVAGNASKVLQAYAAGVSTQRFLMPGCCRLHRTSREPACGPGANRAGGRVESSERSGRRYIHAGKQQKFKR